MDKCASRDALGRPGEGFHKHFGGVAVADVIGTAAIAGAAAYFSGMSFWLIFIMLFIIGEFAHWYYCVDTTVIKLIKKYTQEQSGTQNKTTQIETDAAK